MLNSFSLPCSNKHDHQFCNSCSTNKIQRDSFHQLSLRSDSPLELIFSDVWGPSPVKSIDNKAYNCLFVDHHTRFMWLFPITNKSDVKLILQSLHPLLERQLNRRLLTIYTDGGGEYQALRPYLQLHGIQHFISPPYTPQRVAIAERRHRHIIETAKTLLHTASLPPHFWSYACLQAVHLINRMLTPVLHYKSPFEILFAAAPNFSNLRTFGCLCYPWLRPYTHNKLEPRSTPCIYLGISKPHHSHLCFDPIRSKLYATRDVKFDENVLSLCYYVFSPPNINRLDNNQIGCTCFSTTNCNTTFPRYAATHSHITNTSTQRNSTSTH